MLVLTRRVDESIIIGDDIRIVVVDVRGEQVKLGIEAPRHIPVHREEVYREIQEENRRAAMARADDVERLKEAIQQAAGGRRGQARAGGEPQAGGGARPAAEPGAVESPNHPAPAPGPDGEGARVEDQQPNHG